jgi:PAS domain S-box-containing protein
MDPWCDAEEIGIAFGSGSDTFIGAMPGPSESRLRALQASRLLDSPVDIAFDRITRLASSLVDAPTALVTLVDAQRQFFKSSFGLSEPYASRRETPLSHSFCQHVVRERAPLLVTDARSDRMLRDNLAIDALHVVAYAGVPLVVNRETFGALCVVDNKPRQWSSAEIALLLDLAAMVVSEMELRIALQAHSERGALVNALLQSVGDSVIAVNMQGSVVLANAVAEHTFAEAPATERTSQVWAKLQDALRSDSAPSCKEAIALTLGLRGEDTDALEFSHVFPESGELRWVEANGRPVRGSNGEVIAAVAVCRDVTTKKTRSDLYDVLARGIPRSAVILFDAQLRCIAIDGALAYENGLASIDLVGQPLRSLAGIRPDDPRFHRVEDACSRALLGETVALDFMVGARTLGRVPEVS